MQLLALSSELLAKADEVWGGQVLGFRFQGACNLQPKPCNLKPKTSPAFPKS